MTDAHNDRWDRRFLKVAELVAGWSKDPSTQVGAVIVSAERRILATGYNGFPQGVEDSADRLEDRAQKHLLTVHAEANAVAFAAREGVSLKGSTAYTTHPCCAQCAGLLIQAGVRHVVHLKRDLRPEWLQSVKAGVDSCVEAGVSIERV